MKKHIKTPALKTWDSLNKVVRIANEEQCFQLLKEEKKGRARQTFLLRIHSRLNKVRADRERQALK